MALWLSTLVMLMIPGSGGPTAADVGYVSLCEVISNPAKYDQRTILTSGVVGPSNIIFDPACRPKGDRAHPEVELDSTWANFTAARDEHGTRKRLDDVLDAGKQAFIVVEARFDAYRRYTGQLPENERLRELVIRGNSRFGPENLCRFQLAIRLLKLVESAGPATSP